MSTFFRILIFVGEFIVLWVFTFFAIKKLWKEDSGVFKKWKIYDIIYFSLNNIIAICVFIFSFSSFVFLSYNKMVIMGTMILVYMFLTFLWYADESLRNTISNFVGKMLCTFVVILGMVVLNHAANVSIIPNEICINQEESTQIIYPSVNLKNNAKVGYSLDSDGKTCVYKCYYENNGDIYEELIYSSDSFKIVPIKDKNSYLKKTIKKKTLLNKELKETSKDYTFEEKEITYIIYLNKNDLVEIHNP